MNVRIFLPSQSFGVKFHVKNVGLTGLTETAWSHVNLTHINITFHQYNFFVIAFFRNWYLFKALLIT